MKETENLDCITLSSFFASCRQAIEKRKAMPTSERAHFAESRDPSHGARLKLRLESLAFAQDAE